jgi:pre-mRNA-processing factor 17
MDSLAGYASSDDELLVVRFLPPPEPALPKVVTLFAGTYRAAAEREPKTIDPVAKRQATHRARQLKRQRRQLDFDALAGPWAAYDKPVEPDQTSPNQPPSEPEPEPELELQAPTHKQHVTYNFLDAPKASKHTLSSSPRVARSWDAHAGGVTCLQLLPSSGHLLLSCGNDAAIRLWDCSRGYALVMEYTAHRLAVKHIQFNAKGTRFLSCSFDKQLLLWDTASGDILSRWRLSSVPNVAIFNPNNESQIIAGLANHKIVHYDTACATPADPIQVYTHHLGAINSLTAVDNNTRFLLTADDKSVRIWDWQINIPVKVISDPTLHSMPRVALLPPLGDFIALQCMDNSVQVIQGHGKFKSSSKKFSGHNVAGYGIDVAFTPDGKTLISGDSRGFVFFWDWKTTRLRKLKVDKKPVSCVQPFPRTAGVVVGGASGSIHVCK